MNILESISNPLDNDEFLKKIIDLYKSGKINKSDDLYEELVTKGKNSNDRRDRYSENFKKFVQKSSVITLLTNCGYSSSQAEYIWKTSFESKTNQNEYDIIQKLTFEKGLLMIDNLYDNLETRVNEEVFGSALAMGFHVWKKSLGQLTADDVMWGNYQTNHQIKLYLNIGDDTYEFARLFEEECKKRNLEYYYKVVNPYKSEEFRKDKMCIYTSLKDFPVFLEIVQQVRLGNPKLDYRMPPEIVGMIDSWIGIGIDGEDTSYSKLKCTQIFEALQKISSKKSNINVEDLRSEIYNMLSKDDTASKTHFCLSKEAEKMLERTERPLLRKPKLEKKYMLSFKKLKRLHKKCEKYDIVVDDVSKKMVLQDKKTKRVIDDENLFNEMLFASLYEKVIGYDKKESEEIYNQLLEDFINHYNYKSGLYNIRKGTEALYKGTAISNFLNTQIKRCDRWIFNGIIDSKILFSKFDSTKKWLQGLMHNRDKSQNKRK